MHITSEKTHCVYKMVFPNGEYYFGCTRSIRQRMVSHKYSKTSTPVSQSIQEYGFSHVEIILVTAPQIETIAKKVEAELINEHYNDPYCLNSMNHIGRSKKMSAKISSTLKRKHKQGYYSHLRKNLQPKPA